MVRYVPVPVHRLALGKPLPIDVRTPDGRLLLRCGQTLQSEQHRDMLAAHQASMTDTDAQAWERSLQRSLRAMQFDGIDMAVIARAPMPSEILETDYLEGRRLDGGWLDLQEILRGLLYQGAEAISPLQRLADIEKKALALLQKDPDECLFVLFQALPDLNLGYCATHALLSGAVSALTAEKLALPSIDPALLLRAALVMNIAMARPQDNLARQHKAPNQMQRDIIAAHAPNSADILRSVGVEDEKLLAIVRWHGTTDSVALGHDAMTELRVLNLADVLIAKMAPRASRAAMSPLSATKSLVLESTPDTVRLRQAMAAALGFYPPGSYVQLVNGETAVVIKRGARATTPHVASIKKSSGMPMSMYVYHDTADAQTPQYAVRAPQNSSSVNISISPEKVRRLRQQHGV